VLRKRALRALRQIAHGQKISRKLAPPPEGALKALEKGAASTPHINRIVVGLLGAVLGPEEVPTFPRYRWSSADLRDLPVHLRRAATAVLEWSTKPQALDVGELLLLRIRLVQQEVRRRNRSLWGRKRREAAKKLRKLYPPIRLPNSPVGQRILEIKVFESKRGLPLSESLVAKLRQLPESRIQILGYDQLVYQRWPSGVVSVRLADDGFTVAEIAYSAPAPLINAESQDPIEGELIDFFETGTEGTLWAVQDDRGMDYDSIHVLRAGDHLTIADQFHLKVWEGIIECDTESGWKRYPLNPELGQPCALGRWIHWTQAGFQPDEWASLFMRPDSDRLRGVLIRSDTERP
jgi:hypothetical protein